MKQKRHHKILKILAESDIKTQEQLTDKLKSSGFMVTQATVSRDIKDLRLIKTMSNSGQYKYIASKEITNDYISRYHTIFAESVISADYAGNTVVLRCFPGMAQAACAAIDNMGFETIVGTLAGEDTIFILCRTEGFASQIKDALVQLLKG